MRVGEAAEPRVRAGGRGNATYETLQASRNGGRTRTASGEGDSGNGEVEGARIKGGEADVGARWGGLGGMA